MSNAAGGRSLGEREHTLQRDFKGLGDADLPNVTARLSALMCVNGGGMEGVYSGS